tara:strand:- start:40 stop:198 length:159 start_codon:yes stop_codon:yes gene_type:complete
MTLEIYFNDLSPEAQARYLEFFQLETAQDGNLDIDIVPIFELDSRDMGWSTE